MSDRPIGDHAFLSDCHSSALVATDGLVEWLVFPRFDSPSACGRLLDDTAGHFRVGVADAAEVSRRYVDGSLVLETTFRTADGVLRPGGGTRPVGPGPGARPARRHAHGLVVVG